MALRTLARAWAQEAAARLGVVGVVVAAEEKERGHVRAGVRDDGEADLVGRGHDGRLNHLALAVSE